MSGGWGSLDVGDFWVSQVSLHVFGGGSSNNLVVWDDRGLDDVDGLTSGTVSTGHLGIKHGDSMVDGGSSVLLVHVDNIVSGLISEEDTVVFDGSGFSLHDFTDRDDFTVSSFNLVLSLHLVPELRLGKHTVFSKDSNSIAGWLWFSFRSNLSSNNPVLSKL